MQAWEEKSGDQKSQEDILPWKMNACTKVYSHPSKSCSDISLWTKAVNQQMDAVSSSKNIDSSSVAKSFCHCLAGPPLCLSPSLSLTSLNLSVPSCLTVGPE